MGADRARSRTVRAQSHRSRPSRSAVNGRETCGWARGVRDPARLAPMGLDRAVASARPGVGMAPWAGGEHERAGPRQLPGGAQGEQLRGLHRRPRVRAPLGADDHRRRQRAVLDGDVQLEPDAPQRRVRPGARPPGRGRQPDARAVHDRRVVGRGPQRGGRPVPRDGGRRLPPARSTRATRSRRRPRWSSRSSRQSRPTSGIVTWATEARNQRGELVVSYRRTNLVAKRPSGRRR